MRVSHYKPNIGRLWERLFNREVATLVNMISKDAHPGKLDIKRREPDILLTDCWLIDSLFKLTISM